MTKKLKRDVQIIVKTIKEKYHPEKIILFGSAARGEFEEGILKEGKLSSERWTHIVRRHPEMKEQKDGILETIVNPDIIQQGDYGEFLAIKFFKSTPLTEKYSVVVYKEINKEEGFVITAYFTRKPLERRSIIWKS